VSAEVVFNWAPVVAALVAAIALVINALVLWFNARQFRLNRAQTEAEFWLKLEDMFSPYNDVQAQLRPGGKWSMTRGPETAAEWARVEEYLGVFERTKILLDLELITPLRYKTAFSVRLSNIISNQVIVEEKFRRRAPSWSTFLELLKELDIRLPENHI
jgi:hypothetical protein